MVHHGHGPDPRVRPDGGAAGVAPLPHGHWQTTTLVGGRTADGFVAYIDPVLNQEVRPGDLVVPGALSGHKTAAVWQAFARHHIRVLYRPPYSSDLNPIENAFSKLKRLARRAAERTVDGLWAALGRLLDAFRPAEGANDFCHCGYPATNT